MQIKEQTQNHITKFGISIRDHEEAFAKVLTKDKTRSLNKYHVWYILNKDAVNTIQTPTGPTIDMRGIQRFKLESEESNEFASIVFHKEPMEKALSSCHICYAPLYVCGGWNAVEQFDDLYILELATMTWSKSVSGSGEAWGPRRWNHSALGVFSVRF